MALKVNRRRIAYFWEFHRYPEKILRDRGDVLVAEGFGNNAGSRVFNQLKLIKGVLGKLMILLYESINNTTLSSVLLK